MDAAPEPRRLAPGTMLDDKYRVDELIAFGGMGGVYVGTHIKLRKRVAIKVLNPALSSAQMIERFHREAITASQIGHEGIAQVTDLGKSVTGEPFIVMEYLEGESLAARLKASGPLPIDVACELGCAILSPLAAAHHAGIVHRDLKPDNVFLVRQSRSEMVKLLDFGISRATGLETEFRLTTTGLVLGTPYYMSPEQARGDTDITPAADIYAFGVILYEMLVGAVPIRGDNYNQLMYRVMTGEYARPRQRRPEIPGPLEELIVQAMALEPTHRPPSASAIEPFLASFCRPSFRDRAMDAGSGLLPRMTPMPTPHGMPPATGTAGTALADSTVRPKRRSRLPLLFLAAVLIGGGAAAAIVLTGGDNLEPAKPEPPKPPPEPAVAAPKPPDPPKPPVEPAKPPVEPATITLRFSVEPRGAAITLDGKPVIGGELVVPRDTAEHRLEIKAAGYAPHDETLHFDESQRLEVQLKRAPTRPTPARPNAKPDRIESESPYK
jgi:serine/threonine-protein kinase